MATFRDKKYIKGILVNTLFLMIDLIRKHREIIVLTVSVIFLLLAMFLLPLISAPEYSIIRNTISELGSQSAPSSWILNSIYVSLAFGSLIAGWGFYRGFIFHRSILLVFSVTLILSAFFNQAPVNPGISYNTSEAGWHSYFAGATVLSFIILSLSTGFIKEKQHDRPAAVLAGISIIFLSILMSEAERFAGIWHRLMFMIMFGWQLLAFKFRKSWRIKNYCPKRDIKLNN
ncbi:MAG: DUF998 domain-containing protein [Bacteroidota bacterium]|nr:DUF998 domain-containing protein [Bacteroidota bacterium]